MLPSILLMLRTDLFARPTTKSHKESNHPPSTLRQIPLSIESRLSKHSPNEKIFEESTQIYQEALKRSRYDSQLTYQKPINNKNEETN